MNVLKPIIQHVVPLVVGAIMAWLTSTPFYFWLVDSGIITEARSIEEALTILFTVLIAAAWYILGVSLGRINPGFSWMLGWRALPVMVQSEKIQRAEYFVKTNHLDSPE